MKKNLKYFLEALTVYACFLLGKLLGLSLSRKLFSYIFKKVGPFFKSKKIINKNISRLPKQISENEKENIIKNMWSSYGKTFIEYIFLSKFRKSSSHIKIINEFILDDISNDDKPVIFISGHFSNFELMSMEITKKKINLATIYRPLNNFFINFFMVHLRKKYICKNQITKGLQGVKEAIEYIKSGHSVALMIDQRVSEGEKIKLFNYSALTTTLPAQLAIKYNLKIVPISIIRNHLNDFEMKVFNPIEISKFKNKLDISENLNQILERMIIDNPNQWIWTHDRWK